MKYKSIKYSKELKQQIYPRIELGTSKKLKKYCQKKRITESAVVDEAIKSYLLGASDDMAFMLKSIERVKRIEREMTHLGQEINVLNEAFSMFVQVWFAHTKELQESEKALARKAAWRRYERFCEAVSSLVKKGHKFTDLIQKPTAEQHELSEDIPKKN